MKDSINLLPPKGKAQKQAEQKSAQQKVVIGTVIGLAIGSWVVAFIFLQLEMQKERGVAAQITQVNTNIKRFSQLEDSYKKVYGKTIAAGKVLDQQQQTLKNVTDIKNTVLPNITLSEFNFDLDKLSMSVTSKDSAAMGKYLDSIESTDGVQKIVKNLELNSVALDRATGFTTKIDGEIANGTKN